MQRSIFISHAHEDAHRVSKLEQWSRYGRLGHGVMISTAPIKKKSEASSTLSDIITESIGMSEALVALIGNTVTPRMVGEITLAIEMQKPVVLIRLPYSKGVLPEGLADLPVLSFEPEAIAQAISG